LKIIGVFARRVKTLIDVFVKDPVVELIAFDVIVLELLILVDVIAVVCNVPVLSILPLTVWFPEHIRLFTVVYCSFFDYIIIIDYIFY
jgi:hypothetical protein